MANICSYAYEETVQLIRLLNPAYVYRRRDRIIPLLRAQANDAVRSVQCYLAIRGLPLTINDRRLAALKGRHKGQRCFIIAMGPSLEIADLDNLKGEITFACNKVYLAFDQTDWRPTYYTVLDALIAENNQAIIEKLDILKIFPTIVKSYFQNRQDIIWLRGLQPPIKNRHYDFQFSTNVLKGVYGGWTVIYTQLQLAFYMGIREVYLVGLDFSFEVPEPTGEVCIHGQVLEHKGEINHFHPDYRKPGEKWTMPRLDLQYEAFSCARKIFESHGGSIYNASRKTALDVFPLVSFHDIVTG